MIDVTGSASRVQARRTTPRWAVFCSAAVALCLGTTVFAQDRLPPAPGSVGAIRRDANGQIVPVEPLDPPDRSRRTVRGAAPAAPQGAGPSNSRNAAEDPPSGHAGAAPTQSPNLVLRSFSCAAPAIACLFTRTTGAAGSSAYVTVAIFTPPGMLHEPAGEDAGQVAPGAIPAQLDVLGRHEDGSVSQALVTVALAPQLLSRGTALVLRISAPGRGQPIRVSAL